jgi:membrane-associated protein
LETALHLLIQYKYLVLFPLAIVEGPVIAVIAGFLCTNGFLNPVIVYPLIIAGDIIGDSLCYLLGRWGVPPFIRRLGEFFGIHRNGIEQIRALFHSNPEKIISLSKVILGVGFAGIYLAGTTRIPYNKFVRICFLTSAFQFAIYLSIGLLFGGAFIQISQYLSWFASISLIVVMVILLFFLIQLKLKKL